MKYTGKKWEITGESETGRYITIKADTGRTVARVPWCPDNPEGNDLESDHYDALLIAQAPKLLEALRQLLIGVTNSSDPGMMFYANGIEKLIKEATE